MLFCNIGMSYRKLDQWAEAHQAFAYSLQRWERLGNVASQVNVLDEQARAYYDEGRDAEAVATLADAQRRLETIHDEPDYEHLSKMLRDTLEELASGRAMDEK
jgi:hypothetical protein